MLWAELLEVKASPGISHGGHTPGVSSPAMRSRTPWGRALPPRCNPPAWAPIRVRPPRPVRAMLSSSQTWCLSKVDFREPGRALEPAARGSRAGRPAGQPLGAPPASPPSILSNSAKDLNTR